MLSHDSAGGTGCKTTPTIAHGCLPAPAPAKQAAGCATRRATTASSFPAWDTGPMASGPPFSRARRRTVLFSVGRCGVEGGDLEAATPPTFPDLPKSLN